MPVAPPQQQLHPGADAADRQDHGVSLQTHVSCLSFAPLQVSQCAKFTASVVCFHQKSMCPEMKVVHPLLLLLPLICRLSLNTQFWKSTLHDVTRGE